MDLYDEFGNYVGGDVNSDMDDDDEVRSLGGDQMDTEDAPLPSAQSASSSSSNNKAGAIFTRSQDSNALVLHEDKKYYQDAEELYPTAKTVTFVSDAQNLEEPIIKPAVKVTAPSSSSAARRRAVEETLAFQVALMATPAFTRHVAVIGNIHHGKTSLIGALLDAKNGEQVAADKVEEESAQSMFARKDEQERLISIKGNLSSVVMQTSQGKSFLLNLLDNPGHSNFLDESMASLSVADGVLLVVDSIEGVLMGTDTLIKEAVRAGATVCLCINKVDRLILELKLPPLDAYFKLLHVIEEVNTALSAAHNTFGTPQELRRRVSPELGNVCFASSHHGWSFSLASFAQIYADRAASSSSSSNSSRRMDEDGQGAHSSSSSSSSSQIDVAGLAKRLWGDWYQVGDGSTPRLTRRKPSDSAARSFVELCLEPIYKVYAHSLGSVDDSELFAMLKTLNLKVKKSDLFSTGRTMDPSKLLKIIMSRFLGSHSGVVDMIVQHMPSPLGAAAARKAQLSFSGSQLSAQADAIRKCSPDGPLVAHVSKLYHNAAFVPGGDNANVAGKFFALARIYSGTISAGQAVRVLGEGFTPDDDEDAATVTLGGVSLSTERGSCVVNCGDTAGAGSLVLLEGLDHVIKKTATVVDSFLPDPETFRALPLGNAAIMKVSIEPLKPAELPKMMEALRCVCKSFPMLSTKVEGSGEHCLLGPGELYFDAALHDLRLLYSDIEIKVSDPVVVFCETVLETSQKKCTAETPNRQNRLSLVAEPLDDGLAVDIESKMSFPKSDADRNKMESFFQSKFGWDLMAAHSIWAFGPSPSNGPNVLLDDTLGSKAQLNTVKGSVTQGFQWACREGPLCDEMVRGVKFKILEADISPNPISRGGGQVIPTARRAVYSSFLTACPRLMEPIYRCEIQAPADCIQALYPVIQRRRGFVLEDAAKPGAPFFLLKAYVPAIDSFGFETDLRAYTQGQAYCQLLFDHWAVVPGDPLDLNVLLHPLEPSVSQALARDFMIKTRRRKGLGEDVSVDKYLDASSAL